MIACDLIKETYFMVNTNGISGGSKIQELPSLLGLRKQLEKDSRFSNSSLVYKNCIWLDIGWYLLYIYNKYWVYK